MMNTTTAPGAFISVYRQRPLLMTGLSLLLIGLPLSLFLTSLSQFFLGGSFFLEGPWKVKFKRFFRNPTALVIAGLWVLHLVGLLWTNNLAEGIHDIRIKLPLFVLPVVLSGCEPLERKQFNYLLGLFIAAVTAGTLIYSAVLIGWIYVPVTDVRQIFIFKISHIRFALFVCFSVVACTWFIQHAANRLMQWLPLLTAGWLITFLVLTGSGTGLIVLFVLFMAWMSWLLFKQRRTGTKAVFAGILVLLLLLLYNGLRQVVQQNSLQKDYSGSGQLYTQCGNMYYSDSTNQEHENGYRVWSYIEENEISQNWNRRSSIPIDSLDRKGQLIRGTLVRFLSSKGWKKDSVAVWSLSKEEIAAIEDGIANFEYMDAGPFELRVRQIVWELTRYRSEQDANGHSVTQRIEYWKAALHIIRQHPFFGVGTGDMPEAFTHAYEQTGSKLEVAYRLRSHNQLLALTVAFGLAGGLYFIFLLVFLLRHPNAKQGMLFIGWWIIFVLSIISEDTLETQPGATFFGLFVSLLLFARPLETSVQERSNTSL